MKQFPKLMIVYGIVDWFETEEELEEHVWDLMCNEAERYGDFDEENEDWADFVDRNSDIKAEEYDETDQEQKISVQVLLNTKKLLSVKRL